MNPAFEVMDETVTIEPLPDITALLAVDPADIQPYFDLCKRRAEMIPKPFDEPSFIECGKTIEFIKKAVKIAAALKLRLQTENKDLLDAIDLCSTQMRDGTAMEKLWGKGLNMFIYERNQAVLEAQRIENARVEQERIALEQAEARLKAEAEALAKAGDTSGEAEALAKADMAAATALATMGEVIQVQTKTIDLGDGYSLTGKAPEKQWELAGWDRAKPLRVNNALLDSLVGDVSTLTAELRFILQHADLNPVYLNASYKGGMKFPKPFTEGLKFGGSVLRGGK